MRGVTVEIGALQLAAQLSVAAGELVAVLGPNGSGKSTLLRCIAGLLPIDDGQVVVDGLPLDDPHDGTFVPPEQRPIGMVFQDYLLFPNMTALENVAFGLRATGVARHEARRTAADLARTGRARRPRRAPAGPALGRPGPARRPRSRPGHRPPRRTAG